MAKLQPEWVIGVGAWAEQRAREALAGLPVRLAVCCIPSPASPAANRGWSEAATRQLSSWGCGIINPVIKYLLPVPLQACRRQRQSQVNNRPLWGRLQSPKEADQRLRL
jgi:hypothetical protein